MNHEHFKDKEQSRNFTKGEPNGGKSFAPPPFALTANSQTTIQKKDDETDAIPPDLSTDYPTLCSRLRTTEPKLQGVFVGDFYSKKKALQDFEANPAWMDTWEVLSDLNIRRRIAWHKDLAEWKKHGVGLEKGSGEVKVMDEIRKPKTEIAKFTDDSFRPTEWIASYMGTILNESNSGYKLMRNSTGTGLGFDLGFKNKRKLDPEEVNDYHIKARKAKADGFPYMPGTGIEEKKLKLGEIIYIVEDFNDGEPKPGGWGSRDKLKTIKEFRQKLAVLQDWKDETKFEKSKKTGRMVKNKLVIREYSIIKTLPVRDGFVGPQKEDKGSAAGNIYPGGGHQYEFIVHLGGLVWEDYLKPNKETVLR